MVVCFGFWKVFSSHCKCRPLFSPKYNTSERRYLSTWQRMSLMAQKWLSLIYDKKWSYLLFPLWSSAGRNLYIQNSVVREDGFFGGDLEHFCLWRKKKIFLDDSINQIWNHLDYLPLFSLWTTLGFTWWPFDLNSQYFELWVSPSKSAEVWIYRKWEMKGLRYLWESPHTLVDLTVAQL